MTMNFKTSILSHETNILAKLHSDPYKNGLFTAFFPVLGTDPSTGGTKKNGPMVINFGGNICSHEFNILAKFHSDTRKN